MIGCRVTRFRGSTEVQTALTPNPSPKTGEGDTCAGMARGHTPSLSLILRFGATSLDRRE